MKVTVNRKELVRNLKILRDISKQDMSQGRRFKDVVVLYTLPDALQLMATSGTAFLAVTIPAVVQQEGKCQVNYRLFEIAKAAHDEDLSLSFQSKLSITSPSGLKASLTQNETAGMPVERIAEAVGAGVSKSLTLQAEDVKNLTDISKAFPPTGDLQWIHVTATPDGITGSIHGSEYGTLDAFPMQGDGDAMEIRIDPTLLYPLLTFCTESVRLELLVVFDAFVLVTDPNNDNWWALVAQIQNTPNPQENHAQSTAS